MSEVKKVKEAMVCKETYQMNELPVSVWGLDPIYWCNIKLFVSQIKQIQPYSDLKDSYHFLGHPIKHVEIVGYLVHHRPRRKLFSYTVDDGSGLISCQLWCNPHTDNWHSGQTFKIGDLLRIRGRLTSYRNQIEIQIDTIIRETEEDSQLLHWLEIIHLTSSYYSKNSNWVAEAETWPRISSVGGK